MESAHVSGLGKGPAALPACDRDRSRFCDGPCASGVRLQRDGRVDAGAAEHTQGLPAARVGPATSSASTSTPCTTAISPGNLEREQRTLESWAESYPRDARPHGLVSGFAMSSTGQCELAIAEADKAIALDPDLTPAYGNKAFNQLCLNRLDDALLTVRRAAERKLESAELLLTQYFVAFLKGTDDELRRTAAVGQEEPRRGRHHLAPGGAGAGSLRPLARGETDVRGPRRDRAAVGSARTGRLVRSGHSRMGSVLRECGRSQAERRQGACSSEGAATWTMPRRSRWPSQVICRNREPSPRISRASSRRIRRFNSCICRRFGPCSH